MLPIRDRPHIQRQKLVESKKMVKNKPCKQ